MTCRSKLTPLRKRVMRERQEASRMAKQRLENEPLLDIEKIRLGMKRSEVITEFGQPSLQSKTTRAYAAPSLFRYGKFVLIFEPWTGGGLYGAIEYDEAGKHKQSHIWSPDRKENDETAEPTGDAAIAARERPADAVGVLRSEDE